MVSPEEYARFKQDVYVMRNGVLADALRAAGCPYRLIFGLNLPQLTEIAKRHGTDADMARELRRHTDLRENALLAMMLFPAEELTEAEAIDWAKNEVRWSEDADILTFKLLRHTPFAAAVAGELCADDDRLRRYTGLSLWLKILAKHRTEAVGAAQAELGRPNPLTALASRIIDEADFLSD